MAEKDLMKALGGGGSKKIPWQVKVGALVVMELLLWAITTDLGFFIILSLFALGIGWACFTDWGNVVLTLAVLVFATLLVGTRLGKGMNTIGIGVRQLGEEGSGSVGDLDVQLPQGVPTTITVAPPTPPPAPPAPAPQP